MSTHQAPRPHSEDLPAAISPPPTLVLSEPLLDADQAAELLNVKVSWVREATRNQMLPSIKLGKHVRYTRPMLEAWLAEHRNQA